MADTNNGKQGGSMGGGMSQCPTCGGSMAGKGCCCGGHGQWHHGFGWGVVRLIVALVVLGIVFAVGVLVGELRAVVGGYMGGYGRYPMMHSYGYQTGMGAQGGMMPGAATATTTTP